MITTAIQTAILVAVITAFFNMVRASARRPAVRDPNTGEVVLQFHMFLVWIMAGIAILAPLGLVVLSFIIPFQNERQVYVPIVLGLFFFLLGGWLYLYLARRRTRLSKAGLTSEYVFSRPAQMSWEEVERIKFSLNQQELFLYDAQGRTARLHVWHVGIKEAAPLLRECLPQTVQRSHQEPLAKFFKVVER